MGQRKLVKTRRPQRIIIELYDDFTGKSLHKIDWPYEPCRMLNGWYRLLLGRLKAMFTKDPIFKSDIVGKVKSHVRFVY